jgi:hypothetical protein
MNGENDGRKKNNANPVDSPDPCIVYYEDIDEDNDEGDMGYEEGCDDD